MTGPRPTGVTGAGLANPILPRRGLWALDRTWARCAEGFDVIYLDPMFDVHPTGALPDKRMQYLSQIVDRVMDEHEVVELLDAARRHANNRVVLKRRARAPLIAVPDWQITAKTVRFDVYRPHSRTVAIPKPVGQRSPPTT